MCYDTLHTHLDSRGEDGGAEDDFGYDLSVEELGVVTGTRLLHALRQQDGDKHEELGQGAQGVHELIETGLEGRVRDAEARPDRVHAGDGGRGGEAHGRAPCSCRAHEPQDHGGLGQLVHRRHQGHVLDAGPPPPLRRTRHVAVMRPPAAQRCREWHEHPPVHGHRHRHRRRPLHHPVGGLHAHDDRPDHSVEEHRARLHQEVAEWSGPAPRAQRAPEAHAEAGQHGDGPPGMPGFRGRHLVEDNAVLGIRRQLRAWIGQSGLDRARGGDCV